MSEAISDTGPILHLAEIGVLSVLTIFSSLHLSKGFRQFVREMLVAL